MPLDTYADRRILGGMNGTQMARSQEAQEYRDQLEAIVASANTDGDCCCLCGADIQTHIIGCPMGGAVRLLARWDR